MDLKEGEKVQSKSIENIFNQIIEKFPNFGSSWYRKLFEHQKYKAKNESIHMLLYLNHLT
jgi:hypothetical protein